MERTTTADKPNEAFDQASLREIYEGDMEYMVFMFETFVESIEPELQALEQAFQAQDLVAIKRITHKIKPNFSMVGLPKYHLIAMELEEQCDLGATPFSAIKPVVEGFLVQSREATELVKREAQRMAQNLA